MSGFKRALIIAVTVAAVGCDEGDLPGPCIHRFEDPVVSIVEATDATDGTAVSILRITGITVDGRATNSQFLAREPAFSVTEIEGRLLCEVDCGFGTEEGLYDFRVEAEGYEPLSVEIPANYSTFEGGCPSRNADGTELSVELAPASGSR